MALLDVGTASYRGVMGIVEGHGGAGNAGSVDRASISAELAVLEGFMRQTEKHREQDILAVDPTHRRDAVNLVHYLALRQGDVRHLQRWLGARGLSSLGRCEPHVLATVESVRAAIDGTAPTFGPAIQSFEEGRSALDHNTDALFGPRPAGRVPRIMVTLPTEAADDYSSVTSGLHRHGRCPYQRCARRPRRVGTYGGARPPGVG